MSLICNYQMRLSIYLKLYKLKSMKSFNNQEGYRVGLLEGKDTTQKRIELGDNILTILSKKGIISSLLVEGKQEIDLMADYPQTEVIVDDDRNYSESAFVCKNGKKQVIVGDLKKDGMRLVLLHELEHSARDELAKDKDKAREKFYEIVTASGDDGYDSSPDKTDGHDKVRVAVWLPAVENGRLLVKKFYRAIPKEVLFDYVDSWVKSEKESWQAALEKYHKLKEQGIDLEPNLSEDQIENIVRESLEHYQELLDSMEIEDQIAVPQFWEKEQNKNVDIERLKKQIIDFLEQNDSIVQTDVLDQIKKMKDKVLRESPDNVLDIEVHFGMIEFLLKQKMLRGKKEFSKDIFKDLTEYQYLLTFYVDHAQNRDELRSMWNYFHQIDLLLNKKLNKDKKIAPYLQYGIVGQVAVNKIFRRLKMPYYLSTPSQDAYQKTDAWLDVSKQTALQIKRYKDFSKPVLLPVKYISFPALVKELPTSNTKRIYSVADELRLYAMKKEKLAEMEGKEVEAFMVILPGKGIDNITGEPSEEVVDFFRQHLSKFKHESA